MIRRSASRKHKDSKAIGNRNEDVGTERVAKERRELGRKYSRCRQRALGLEHGTLNDFVLVANEARFKSGEHLGGGLGGRGEDFVTGYSQGENFLTSQGKDFAVNKARRHQNSALRPGNRPARVVMHERGLDEQMPGVVRRGPHGQRQYEKADSVFEFSHSSVRESEVMIAFLEGVLEEALPTQIIVNVHGVGYHVMIPLSSFERLPEPGSPVKILTHLVVREDSHVLYGFGTVGERDLFRLLLNNVSGVGPKLALAILSGMSVEMFKAAVVSGDIAAISRIKGVGKKTAERVVLELKDKVGVAAEWEAASAANAPSERDQAVHDAVLALISLGYKQLEAHKAIKQCLAESSDPPASDDLVRMALRILA